MFLYIYMSLILSTNLLTTHNLEILADPIFIVFY
jgi:hypothetical protein